MEDERMYIVKREMAPTKGASATTGARYFELTHYQTLDEAVLRLFKGHYDELFKSSAAKQKFPFFVASASIVNAKSGNDLMAFRWVKANNLPEETTHRWMHDRVFLDMGQAKAALGTPLKELFSEFIRDFDQVSSIPMADLFGGIRTAVASHINMRLAVLEFAKPESPRLSNYGAVLRVSKVSKGRYGIKPGTRVEHIAPFNDFSFALPRMLSVDLAGIGSTTEAKIMHWENKTPVIELVSRKGEADSRQNGLYFEFKSEAWKMFVETSFPQLPLLSGDAADLSIRIGQYGHNGSLHLTPEFSAFRDAVTSAIEIRRMNQFPRTQLPAPGIGKNALNG